MQRGGDVGSRRLDHVQHVTIKPLIQATMTPGTGVYTDAYDISSRLEPWGDEHASVWHSRGAYARDDDGEGLHAVHVNTLEGLWSLLRSWLRPHRGISPDNVPLYWGCFAFVHNVRRRGKALLRALLELLLTSLPGTQIEPSELCCDGIGMDNPAGCSRFSVEEVLCVFP